MSVTREQPTTNLFLLEELEDVSRTRQLADSDLDALRAVADWIRTFVARPHKDLGRAGPVCPFVLEPWSAALSGLLLSRSPAGACQTLPLW
jgi:hypothetical protein